jgi:LacI family transcriptional regulator
MEDIAKRANVSKSTVSRVLSGKIVNPKTRQTILTAVDELGFSPNLFARGLASGRSMTIGVVTQDVSSPYFDSVTLGIIRAFEDSDYSPIIMAALWSPKKEIEVIQTLIDRRVDGLILVGGRLSEGLKGISDIPTIYVGSESPERVTESIYVDNEQPAYEATSHLIDYGHRSVAVIRGPQDQRDARSRYVGFCRAMAERGIEVDQDLVLDSEFSARSGALAMNTLLLRGKPFTAVFCGNDRLAMGARQTLFRHKVSVPDEVSLIGFDDQPETAYMTPALTTVRQPTVEMGFASAKAMLGLLQDGCCELPDLKATLIVRDSVARINGFLG